MTHTPGGQEPNEDLRDIPTTTSLFDSPLRRITHRFFLTDRGGRRWVMTHSTTYCLTTEPDPAELRRHLTRKFKSMMLHQIDRQDLLFGSTIGDLSIVEEKVEAWIAQRIEDLHQEGE